MQFVFREAKLREWEGFEGTANVFFYTSRSFGKTQDYRDQKGFIGCGFGIFR